MIAEHTPGKWQVVPDAPGYNREMAECIVWGPDGPGHGAVAHTSPFLLPYPGGRQAADARLIAAAPDLLEACLAGAAYSDALKRLQEQGAAGRIVESGDLDRLFQDWHDKVHAALDRLRVAKGEGNK